MTKDQINGHVGRGEHTYDQIFLLLTPYDKSIMQNNSKQQSLGT